jgi:hypothetical protein
MPHNYIVLGTNPDPGQVKQDVTDAATRRSGATKQNTFYFDLDNKRAYAFCGFATDKAARDAIGPMAKELSGQYRVQEFGFVSTATELGLRAKPGGSRRTRRAHRPRGGTARRRRR